MVSVVVDIDDTLISTDRRMQNVWRQVLGREVPLDAVRAMDSSELFLRFASSEQKARAVELQGRFWNIVLCLEEGAAESVRLHEAFPFAAHVLQTWSKRCAIVYLTGRTENTRDITLHELRGFGFPADNAQLLMFGLEDYARMRGENPSGPTLVDAKARLLSSISKEHDVVRVVDDYPGYFPVYKQFGIPERIGLLRSKRYSPQQYIDKGATKVVGGWEQLQNDQPQPI
jgi:hypothetical protein